MSPNQHCSSAAACDPELLGALAAAPAPAILLNSDIHPRGESAGGTTTGSFVTASMYYKERQHNHYKILNPHKDIENGRAPATHTTQY